MKNSFANGADSGGFPSTSKTMYANGRHPTKNAEDASPHDPTSTRKKKNAPRFLDYRRSPLPLDVALSFALPTLPQTSVPPSAHPSPRDLILEGKVHVNDTLETNCHRLVCRKDDRIVVDGAELERPIGLPRYFVCYKPRGVVCSSRRNDGIDREDSVLISDWLTSVFEKSRTGNNSNITFDTPCVTKAIKTVGRLDEESEGLLLLTNDGSFSRLLCDPEFGLRKTYRVVARGTVGLPSEKCVHEKDQYSNRALAKKVAQMIEKGNEAPLPFRKRAHSDGTEENGQGAGRNIKLGDATTDKPHFPFESCNILDVGKLPMQHSSDTSVMCS